VLLAGRSSSFPRNFENPLAGHLAGFRRSV